MEIRYKFIYVVYMYSWRNKDAYIVSYMFSIQWNLFWLFVKLEVKYVWNLNETLTKPPWDGVHVYFHKIEGFIRK
jgi:hypothetical protein